MCEHCRNITETCPVCGPKTDRIEPVEILTKVTHCSDCPMGEYWDNGCIDGYDCLFDRKNVKTVIRVNYSISNQFADDQPLP